MTTHAVTWAERVNLLQERIGTRKALAERLGASEFTVLRWRKGEKEPLEVFQRAIEALEREVALAIRGGVS